MPYTARNEDCSRDIHSIQANLTYVWCWNFMYRCICYGNRFRPVWTYFKTIGYLCKRDQPCGASLLSELSMSAVSTYTCSRAALCILQLRRLLCMNAHPGSCILCLPTIWARSTWSSRSRSQRPGVQRKEFKSYVSATSSPSSRLICFLAGLQPADRNQAEKKLAAQSQLLWVAGQSTTSLHHSPEKGQGPAA